MLDVAEHRGGRQGRAGQIGGAVGGVDGEEVGQLVCQGVAEDAQHHMRIGTVAPHLQADLQVRQIV